ncbi:MAG: hypothetical protein GX853_01995, partial [Chloroflexi bacterium]|nr:hypothetical protein [Chloroflexota bacterium]
MEASAEKTNSFDMKKVLKSPKLLSLWHLMKGYHFNYFVATVALAISALARAGIFLYLGRFIDALR